MNYLHNLKVAVIDFETTGLEEDAQAVEMAIVHLYLGSGDQELVYCQKFKPTKKIHPKASAVHGMYASDLEDCPSFKDEWPKIESFLEDRVISAYNLPFDLRILRNECPVSPNLYHKMVGICGLVISRHLTPYSIKDKMGNRLTESCIRNNILIGNGHSASCDAMAASELLFIQIKKLSNYFNNLIDFLAWQRIEGIDQEREKMFDLYARGRKMYSTPWISGL
tara:strand:- start:1099 stop:1767 length:669 start_codon:yes stop_codon:yes gene_type:complete